MTDNKDTPITLQGLIIPPEPQVLVDIHMEQSMPNPDISAIADLISSDAGLSGSILKLVNSACFETKGPVECIKEAVNIMGINAVINLVNGLSIKGEISDELVVNMTKFWDSATDVATVAMLIAKRLDFPSPDTAYNIGLFHNCGIPLLIESRKNYLEVMSEGYSASSERIIDPENKHYKTNHAVLGYYVAKSWRCSKDFCEVIADHHNSERIFKSSYYRDYCSNKKTLLGILKLAEHICGLNQVLGSTPEDHEWSKIESLVLDYLGITAYEYDSIVDMINDLNVLQVKELCA